MLVIGLVFSYPSEALFRCSTLGLAPELTYKRRPDWKGLLGPNILDHYKQNYGRKKFYNVGPGLHDNNKPS